MCVEYEAWDLVKGWGNIRSKGNKFFRSRLGVRKGTVHFGIDITVTHMVSQEVNRDVHMHNTLKSMIFVSINIPSSDQQQIKKL